MLGFLPACEGQASPMTPSQALPLCADETSIRDTGGVAARASLRRVTSEQRQLLEDAGPVQPSEGQTPQQALNFHPLREKVYVSGDVHTQTIEGFFSNLKRGIAGAYHAVSSKWLPTYLNEYAWR